MINKGEKTKGNRAIILSGVALLFSFISIVISIVTLCIENRDNIKVRCDDATDLMYYLDRKDYDTLLERKTCSVDELYIIADLTIFNNSKNQSIIDECSAVFQTTDGVDGLYDPIKCKLTFLGEASALIESGELEARSRYSPQILIEIPLGAEFSSLHRHIE